MTAGKARRRDRSTTVERPVNTSRSTLVLFLVLASACSEAPPDSGMDGGVEPDASEPDAGPRPPCSATPPVVLCADVSSSETTSGTPDDPGVLRLEVEETRASACDGPWTFRRCNRVQIFWSASAGETVTEDEACEDVTVLGGGIVRCLERTSYEVGGELRWERTIAWDVSASVRER
jgi:hypothetical protein